jgi:ABC-type Fe3+-hydroxamate transport system substrate-binding protein
VGIDYEALLRVRPTHVLLQRADIPNRLRELGAQRAPSWDVENFRILSLDDIRSLTRGLWAMLRERAADPGPLARLQREMDRAWSRRSGIDAAKVGRVLLLHSASPPAAFGPGSFHQQILERLGATPAVTEGAAYITMDHEDLLRRRPDAIVLFAPHEPGEAASARGAADVRAALGPIADLDIPAVRSGRLAVIDHPMAVVPCPSAMIEVADDLARILEHWSRPPP